MQGDFSRDSFDARRAFSRVLNQQGRVVLDADWNELQSIQLHLLRTLAADLIGPHGGAGFDIDSAGDGDFRIMPGRYYVDGWLCESVREVWYAGPGGAGKGPAQPYWSVEKKTGLADGRYLVYLDVWERHLSWAETDDRDAPALREVALGGADTASRAQVVWQVKAAREHVDLKGNVQKVPPGTPAAGWPQWLEDTWSLWTRQWQAPNRGLMTAETDKTGTEAQSPCAVSPQARYRGVENQLYRVEIHQSGVAGKSGATFKWSRENASVVFPVESVAGTTVKLSAWWRDARQGLAVGDWIEVVDDVVSLHQIAHPLCRVKAIDQDAMTVILDTSPEVMADDAARHPILRRWDQRGEKTTHDGMLIDEAGTASFVLEDGIRLRFKPAVDKKQPHRYRTGDYWLIPARTAIADIIWPRDVGGVAEARAPAGVEHHFAPLAVVEITGTAGSTVASLRKAIKPAAA